MMRLKVNEKERIYNKLREIKNEIDGFLPYERTYELLKKEGLEYSNVFDYVREAIERIREEDLDNDIDIYDEYFFEGEDEYFFGK